MKLSKSAIGVLSAQYRSVLKKCFLINATAAMMFALPAMANASVISHPGVKVSYTGGELVGDFAEGILKDGSITLNLSGFETPEGESGYGAFTNLYRDGDGNPYYDLLANDAVKLVGGSFENNTSANAGGALTLWHDGRADEDVYENTISGTTFSGNKATNMGGAISLMPWYAFDVMGKTTISDATFEKNSSAIGGAIYNQHDELVVSNSTFEGNTSKNNGGAIYNEGNLTIKDSVFTGNTASKGAGAIRNDGSLEISGSEFTGNTATSWFGAIWSTSNAISTKITDTTFTLNEAGEVGGVSLCSAENEVKNVTFKSNKATSLADDSDGAGAMFLGAISKTVLDNVTFDSNETNAHGGAISTRTANLGNNVAARLDILNSSFTGNTAAKEGGAFDNYFYSSKANDTAVYIANTSFTGNSADKGGAIYGHGAKDLGGNTASLEINNSTFTENTAKTAGGALYNEVNGGMTLSGKNVFSGNMAGGALNDIYNDGDLKVSGDLTLDGGISGDGTVTFAKDTNLTVKASVDGDGTTISNEVVNNGANLNLVFANGYSEGKYTLVTGSLDKEFNVTNENNLFNIVADESVKGSYLISKKSAEEVSETTGADDMQVSIIDAISAGETKNATFNEIADTIYTMLQSTDENVINEALTAVTVLAPEVAPVVNQTQTETVNQVFNAVGTRLSGGTIATTAEGMSSGDGALEDVAVWVQGLYNKAKLNNTSKVKGFKADTAGVALGIEKRMTSDFKAGVGYAYNNTDVDGFMRDTDVDTYSAILYGEYKPNNWYANAVATYSWSDYTEKKTVLGKAVKSEYDVRTFGVQAMTGYDFNVGGFGLTPEAGLRYINVDNDSYVDSIGQSVESDRTHTLTGVVGLKTNKDFSCDCGTVFRPEIKVALTYDMLRDDNNSVVSLTNGTSYKVNGKPLDRFGVEVGAGLTAEVNDNIEFALGYEGRFRDDYQDHTGLINAKYKF